jgi:hypothetical protein
MSDMLDTGAAFVLLDEPVVPVARGLDMLGRPLALRIVAESRDHGDPVAVAIDITPGAAALRPLAPVQLRAARGNDGVMLSFVRRTRVDGDSWEALDVPLGEAQERYEIDILDGASVKRTLSSDVSPVLYPNAAELADFGTPQSELSIRVFQMSAVVGRGHAAFANLNP